MASASASPRQSFPILFLNNEQPHAEDSLLHVEFPCEIGFQKDFRSIRLSAASSIEELRLCAYQQLKDDRGARGLLPFPLSYLDLQTDPGSASEPVVSESCLEKFWPSVADGKPLLRLTFLPGGPFGEAALAAEHEEAKSVLRGDDQRGWACSMDGSTLGLDEGFLDQLNEQERRAYHAGPDWIKNELRQYGLDLDAPDFTPSGDSSSEGPLLRLKPMPGVAVEDQFGPELQELDQACETVHEYWKIRERCEEAGEEVDYVVEEAFVRMLRNVKVLLFVAPASWKSLELVKDRGLAEEMPDVFMFCSADVRADKVEWTRDSSWEGEAFSSSIFSSRSRIRTFLRFMRTHKPIGRRERDDKGTCGRATRQRRKQKPNNIMSTSTTLMHTTQEAVCSTPPCSITMEAQLLSESPPGTRPSRPIVAQTHGNAFGQDRVHIRDARVWRNHGPGAPAGERSRSGVRC